MNDIPLPPINIVQLKPMSVAGTAQNPSQPPSVLSQLPNGTMVSGFVIRRDAQNQPVLRTEFGDVLMNTALFIKTGTEVMLRVDATQTNHARILTINGQSPEAFAKLQATQAQVMSDEVTPSAMMPSAQNTMPVMKPMLLNGMLLKLQPDAALPAPLIEAAVRMLRQSQKNNVSEALPVSIVLRAIHEADVPSAHTLPTTMRNPIDSPKQNTASSTPQPSAMATPAQQTEAQTKNVEMAAKITPAFGAGPPPKEVPTHAVPASTAKTASSVMLQQNLQSAQSVFTPKAEAPSPTSTPPQVASTTAPFVEQPMKSALTMKNIPAASLHTAPSVVPYALTSPHTHDVSTPTIASRAPLAMPDSITLRIEAVVMGHEANGDTILHTPLGTMKAFTPKPLGLGQQVTLDITPNVASSPMTGLPSSLPDEVQDITQIARDWPALSELLESLRQTDAQAYQQLLQHTVPTTGKNLTHGMLFFLSALKGGDMKQWINQKAVEALDSKKQELWQRLTNEFGMLQQASVETSQLGWMTTAIPIWHEGILQQARFYLRHEAGEKEETLGSAKGGQRFIIEVELTQLGEMQIDGFVQKEGGRNQFDIIIRSSRALPLQMQQGIREIYTNAASIAGFKGMLSFQASRDSFVRPLSTMQRSGLSGIMA